MSEVWFGDADAGLADRLDEEISASNAAVTGAAARHAVGGLGAVTNRAADGTTR